MEKKIYIVFRNDDLCALSDPIKEQRILRIFEKYNIPQVVSVTPNVTEDPHNANLSRFHPLEENRKIVSMLDEYHKKGLIEIAQHGFTHQTSIHYPSLGKKITDNEYFQGIDRKWLAYKPAISGGYSEFGGLSISDQKLKILQGRDQLKKIFNTDIKTFVFPWERLTTDGLNIIKENGFQYVLGSDHTTYLKGLNLIKCSLWDRSLFQLPNLLDEIKHIESPVLIQACYHSWMLSETDIDRLEDTFRSLSTEGRVKFITAKQISEYMPDMSNIIKLRHQLNVLMRKTNPYLGHKICQPDYYVIDKKHFYIQLLKVSAIHVLVRYIGYRKALIFTGIVLALFAGNEFNQHQFQQMAHAKIAVLMFLVCMFMSTVFLNIRKSINGYK